MADERVDDLTLKGCLAGMEPARGRLYDLSVSRVIRLCSRIVGHNEVDDVVQQVYLRLFEQLPTFKGESTFETWLFKIAVNESLQQLRRVKRQKSEHLEIEPMAPASHIPTQIEQHELLEIAMQRIDADLRAIFLLREVEHLSYAQLAEALEIPSGTVASRLNRARQELQCALLDLGWEP